jgi:serralysin
MANVARWALTSAVGSSYSGVSQLSLTENTGSPGAATIRIGMSNAYYPSAAAAGGDVWMGTQTGYDAMTSPVRGNYAFDSMMHELGHALGLKHGQEAGGVANVAMTAAHDGMEYSIMTYRSYIGGPTTG